MVKNMVSFVVIALIQFGGTVYKLFPALVALKYEVAPNITFHSS